MSPNEGQMISAQVSLYPLRRESIGPVIRKTVRILESFDVDLRVGEMNTLVWGEERPVFDALEAAFRAAAEEGDTVMTVTISNACPSPARGQEATGHTRRRGHN